MFLYIYYLEVINTDDNNQERVAWRSKVTCSCNVYYVEIIEIKEYN